MKAGEYYYWYKQHKICVDCRQARALEWRVRCAECLYKDAERHHESREKNTDEYKRADATRKMRIYYERKEQGLCVHCGKRKPKAGKVRCGICLAKVNRSTSRYYQARGRRPHGLRTDHDVCYNCFGVPLKGKRLCAECYEKALANLDKANKAINWDSHPWRRYKSEQDKT